MGRYANTAAGELKLTVPLAVATGHVVGSERGRDSVVVLTRAEVQEVISTLLTMHVHHLAHPEDKESVLDKEMDPDTKAWYLSHLRHIPEKVRYLENWLGLGLDELVFA